MKDNSLNRKKTVKALIIRNIVLRELSNQSLEKSEIEKDLKILGIPKNNFEYHLYSKSRKEYGLIPKGIIKSKKGKLSLNWNNFKGLVGIVEYLENDEKYGKLVKYLVDRAFVEAFYSDYGDTLLNEWRLTSYLGKKLDLKPFLPPDMLSGSEEAINKMQIFFDLFDSRLWNAGYRVSGGSILIFLRWGIKKVDETLVHQLNEILDRIDILDALVGFAEFVRGEDSLGFKIAYILKAIERLDLVRDAHERGYLSILKLSDMLLLYEDNEDIMDVHDLKDSTYKQFRDRLFGEVFRDNAEIDRSLKNEKLILNLFYYEGLHQKEQGIKTNIETALNSYPFEDKEFGKIETQEDTKKVADAIIKRLEKRWEMKLKDREIRFSF